MTIFLSHCHEFADLQICPHDTLNAKYMDATNAKSQQLGRGKILMKPRAEESLMKVRSPLSPTAGVRLSVELSQVMLVYLCPGNSECQTKNNKKNKCHFYRHILFRFCKFLCVFFKHLVIGNIIW